MHNFIKTALKKTEKLPLKEKLSIYEELLKNLSDDEDMMVTLLDSISTGLMVSDSDNRIIFINKFLGDIIRIKRNELFEKAVWEVIADQDISNFVKDGILSDKKYISKVFNYTYQKKNYYIEVCISALKSSSSRSGYVINVENVTDRELEKNNTKRAESFASLTALAAGVAHEIKNPLGSISIYLQLMAKQLGKKIQIDDVEAFKVSLLAKVDILENEVQRLNDIVVDFLSTIRPREAALTEESLNDVIKKAVLVMTPELEKNNIVVHLVLEENLPLLMLDTRYMHQALTNLIVNARDAMKSAKEKTLTITTEKDSDCVTMLVSDTGTGILPKNLAKIFDPYFTTKKSGSGIGLTLVYKVIKGHNGDISVTSKEGEGTTFKIVLPRIEKEIKQIEWEKK